MKKNKVSEEKVRKLKQGVNIRRLRELKREDERYQRQTEEQRFAKKYTILRNKTTGKVKDVQLHFGTWTGLRISEMSNDPRGVSYIRTFLLDKDQKFPETFRKAVRKVFRKNYDEDDIHF